eukprot:360774-Chlamydomonas_euryale.AAC.12
MEAVADTQQQSDRSAREQQIRSTDPHQAADVLSKVFLSRRASTPRFDTPPALPETHQYIAPMSSSVGSTCRATDATDTSSTNLTVTMLELGMPSSACAASSLRSKLSTEPIWKKYL